ncbi:MAG TPA: hypothetical protein VK914_09985 [bacterium]|jgi:uncharacterized membrane protein|nr:hypothetical protein [bacterium]
MAAVAALVFPALVLIGIWTGVNRMLLACLLAGLALWRWGPWLQLRGSLALGLGTAACAWLALRHADLSLRAYPICVNLGLLAVFGLSLWRGPSAVERIATLRQGPLDETGVRYTRTVTKAWCFFFALNGALSLATAVAASDRVWALYNGAIAYGLMGIMFGAEWLVRQRVLGRTGTQDKGL